MGQRVVMRLTDYSFTTRDLKVFLERAEELGVHSRTRLVYSQDSSGNAYICAEVPERAVESLRRKSAPPRRTKAQQAVSDQLSARKAAVQSGAPVPGHVPAVKGAKRTVNLKTRRKRK